MTQATASLEEMKAARIPLEERDGCAGLLIPLNECRYKSSFLTYKCEHERLEYEFVRGVCRVRSPLQPRLPSARECWRRAAQRVLPHVG